MSTKPHRGDRRLALCSVVPNVMKRLSSGTPEAYLSALFHANRFGGQP